MPKFSICIPTYNRSELITKAIESVVSQTYNDFELIIIDNNSDYIHRKKLKDFLEKLDNPLIKFVQNDSNIGMFNNWNKCLSISNGEYITILSDDDLLHVDFLKISSEVLSKVPGSCLFVRKQEFNVFSSNELILRNLTNKNYDNDFKVYELNKNIFSWFNALGTPVGFVFPNEKNIKFRETYFPSADYLFTLEVSNNKRIIYLDSCLAFVGYGDNYSMKLNVINGFKKKDLLIKNSFYKCGFFNNMFTNLQHIEYLIKFKHLKLPVLANIYSLFFRLLRKFIFKRHINEIYYSK